MQHGVRLACAARYALSLAAAVVLPAPLPGEIASAAVALLLTTALVAALVRRDEVGASPTQATSPARGYLRRPDDGASLPRARRRLRSRRRRSSRRPWMRRAAVAGRSPRFAPQSMEAAQESCRRASAIRMLPAPRIIKCRTRSSSTRQLLAGAVEERAGSCGRPRSAGDAGRAPEARPLPTLETDAPEAEPPPLHEPEKPAEGHEVPQSATAFDTLCARVDNEIAHARDVHLALSIVALQLHPDADVGPDISGVAEAVGRASHELLGQGAEVVVFESEDDIVWLILRACWRSALTRSRRKW